MTWLLTLIAKKCSKSLIWGLLKFKEVWIKLIQTLSSVISPKSLLEHFKLARASEAPAKWLRWMTNNLRVKTLQKAFSEIQLLWKKRLIKGLQNLIKRARLTKLIKVWAETYTSVLSKKWSCLKHKIEFKVTDQLLRKEETSLKLINSELLN